MIKTVKDKGEAVEKKRTLQRKTEVSELGSLTKNPGNP